MGVRFCVLGSGSAGNASLVCAPSACVLLDLGFGPQQLETRMKGTGVDWTRIRAVVLTHTHRDHIKPTNFKTICQLGIPFYCHEEQLRELERGRFAKRILKAGLVRTYAEQVPFEVAGEFLFHPLAIPHDSPPTFGFRIEAADRDGTLRRLGYLCDLGHWTPLLAEAMREVDLLALEFNHDEDLQLNSGRHPNLISRVLGDFGHLSNNQACALLRKLLSQAPGKVPAQLVQMHLSEECNRPLLAFQTALRTIREAGANTKVYSSRQDQRGSVLQID